MAKHKEPSTLYNISLRTLSYIILQYCVQLENIFGKYENLGCQYYVKHLQTFLLQYLPNSLLDDVRMKRRLDLEYGLTDHRIILGVYLHEKTTKLTCTNTLRTIPNKDFWLGQILNLKNLKSLDLRLMCTDELLSAIGANCPNLEFINCVSKNETMSGGQSAEGDFNALRIKLCVSDEGLYCLSNCKKLKKVIMNRQIIGQRGGKKLSYDGIRRLLCSLPNLRSLQFDNLGNLISYNMEHVQALSLVELSDSCPSSHNIIQIDRLCPKLKKLILHYSAKPKDEESETVIRQLTNSKLKLEWLALERFPFDDSITEFIIQKGEYLKSLNLMVWTNMTSQDILLIGEYCKNLTEFSALLSPEESSTSYCKRRGSNEMFKYLTDLALGGIGWNPNIVLPICVIPAKNIRSLTVSNDYIEPGVQPISRYWFFDDLFNNLMRKHLFNDLKSLVIKEGCLLSFATIRKLIDHCPNISSMQLCSIYKERVAFNDLVAELRSYNYNVQLYSSYSSLKGTILNLEDINKLLLGP